MPVAMFIGSFIYVNLPFHIQHISTRDPASTLRGRGWILSVTPLVAVVAGPLWGRCAGLGKPKHLFTMVQELGLASLPLAAWRDPAPAREAR